MKLQPKVIDISPIPGLHLDPTFTSEEATILRSLVAGKSDKHDLRMPPDSFVRVIGDIWEKTATTSNLVVGGQRRMKNGDRQLDKPEDIDARRLAILLVF
jgi:hypothetical protein